MKVRVCEGWPSAFILGTHTDWLSDCDCLKSLCWEGFCDDICNSARNNITGGQRCLSMMERLVIIWCVIYDLYGLNMWKSSNPCWNVTLSATAWWAEASRRWLSQQWSHHKRAWESCFNGFVFLSALHIHREGAVFEAESKFLQDITFVGLPSSQICKK